MHTTFIVPSLRTDANFQSIISIKQRFKRRAAGPTRESKFKTFSNMLTENLLHYQINRTNETSRAT